jgi:endogenous inhibitor of DNA gyrase (YacG/DUF329 family)
MIDSIDLCPECQQPVRPRYQNYCSEYCRIYAERTRTVGGKLRLIGRPDLEISCEWCGEKTSMNWADRKSHQRFCSMDCKKACQKKKTWTLFNICRILARQGPLTAKEIAVWFNHWGLQNSSPTGIAGLIRCHLGKIVHKGENGYELAKNGDHALAWGFESTY